MSYQTLTYQKSGGVGIITLNRPEANNAINAELSIAMADLCSEINQDPEIRVVTVTGAGEMFSVGTEWDSPPEEVAPRSVATAVYKLNCPVIAAINGDALGQGLELALACDLRIAAETARLGLPQIASDLIPWDGGTQRLPRLIGRAKALEMILLGETISAGEACRLGLVNKVVPLKELFSVVDDMAQRMTDSAPLALRYTKEVIHKGLELILEQGLRLETDLYTLLQTTRDRTEGITSFLEKRTPRFKGE